MLGNRDGLGGMALMVVGGEELVRGNGCEGEAQTQEEEAVQQVVNKGYERFGEGVDREEKE